MAVKLKAVRVKKTALTTPIKMTAASAPNKKNKTGPPMMTTRPGRVPQANVTTQRSVSQQQVGVAASRARG